MFKLGLVLLVACVICTQAKPASKTASTLCRAPNGITSPCYQLIRKTTKYEERKYVSSLWASTSEQVAVGTKISGKISRSCYMRLRGYLSSHNVTMGVPILYTIKAIPGGKVDFTMSFFLPNNGPNFQPPAPHDKRVRLENKPSMNVYVKVEKNLNYEHRFSKTYAQLLSGYLKADGLAGKYTTPDIMFMAAGYDAPWTAKRTNEFWLLKA